MLTRDELLDKMVQEITGALSVHFKTFLKEATRTCINCASWSEDGDFCTKYNQKPPAYSSMVLFRQRNVTSHYFLLKKNKSMRSILAKLYRKQLKPFQVIVSYPEGHITGSMILRRSRDADIQRTVQEINSKIEET